MSYQFKLVSLYRLSGPGVALDHDGKPYANPNTYSGMLLGVDNKGHLYFSDYMSMLALAGAKAIFENKKGSALTMFRDHWRHAMRPHELATQASGRSPYNNALMAAPRDLLWGAGTLAQFKQAG